jgi:hypothetical protein
LFSGIISINTFAQVKVSSSGNVRIGSETFWNEGRLQIMDKNRTTEARIFATSPNIARLWAMNQTYAYGFGIGADGKGYIWHGVDNNPNTSYLMKFDNYKTFFNTGTYGIWFDYSAGEPTIRPSSGNFGYIGTNSNYWNKIYTRYIYRYSEQNFLKSASTNGEIEVPISKILQIKGYYKKSSDQKLKSASNNDSCNEITSLNYGIYVNEVRELFPELVDYNDSLNIYGIDYDGFIPVLIEAFKEQQTEIANLKSEIEDIKLSSSLETQIGSKTSEHILYQNLPNPFSEVTTIKYFLSTDVKLAMLNIYDMQGAQVKSYQLQVLGESEIKINASELDSGMYLYALIADGQEVDVKRMILTD